MGEDMSDKVWKDISVSFFEFNDSRNFYAVQVRGDK